MIGQINLNSKAGDWIKKISSNSDVKIIVEIGTWNGAGSTRCIAEGLKSNEEAILISLECNKSMYDIASPQWINHKNIKIVFGRIVEIDELDTDNLSQEEQSWIYGDIVAMKECANVLNQLPMSIDFLILDGGEFSTLAEFNKLVNRCNYIFLDDTRCRKNRQTRKVLLESEDFESLEDHPEDRNGWSLFKRKSS